MHADSSLSTEPSIEPEFAPEFAPEFEIETDWIKIWAYISPKSIAVQEADSGLAHSYAQLLYLSCRIAKMLEDEFQVAHGDRVALVAQNELESIALFFAVQRLGAILVPLNFRLAKPELMALLRNSEPKVVISQERFYHLLPLAEQDPETETALAKIPPLQLQIRANVKTKLWSFDSDAGADPALHESCSVRHFVLRALKDFEQDEIHTSLRRDHPTKNWFRATKSKFRDPCLILYTSGTTGTPKGAVMTNRMLHWNSLNTSLRLNINQNDVTIGFSPLFHTSGWNVLLTPFLHRGAKTILMKRFSASRLLELCEKERVTIIFGVPTTMAMIVSHEAFVTTSLTSLRYAVVGGEPMPIELIKTWQIKGVPIRQGYGLTEFGPGVFSLNQEDAVRKIGSVGFPNFYIETKIQNEAAEDVGPNEIGELLLRGPVCMSGYWRNEVATHQAIRDGWLYTGDLVKRDEEGYFYIVGRKRDMFISGGENIFPAEVEQVIGSHPAILEVAVIGVSDAKWGQVGKAFIVLKPGARIGFEEINLFCAEYLAKYKIPKSLTIIDELPKGASGKILKSQLIGS